MLLMAVGVMAASAVAPPVSRAAPIDAAPIDTAPTEAAPVDTAPLDTALTDTAPPDSRPPISANDFIPDDRDLTSCIGVLERPGCGSESRGGWRQTLVFVALLVGLVVVFSNVARGVRRRDR